MSRNRPALPRAGIFPKPRHLAARMGRWSAAHRMLAIFGWVAFVALALALAAVVGTRNLGDAEGGVGESGRAERMVAKAGFADSNGEVVLVQSRTLKAESAQFRHAVRDLAAELRQIRGVRNLRLPYGRSNADQISDDKHSTVIRFDYVGSQVADALAVVAKARTSHPELYIGELGQASADKQIEDTVGKDFRRAEIFSIPLTLIILLVAFGALFAAGIPLLLALSAVAAATGVLAVFSHLVPADDSAGSVILLIGLAVGVDYSLFYIRREREERALGKGPETALEAAAATSGRAVLLSGLTVLIAMAGMLLSGSKEIVSVGVGAMVVVAVAVGGSLTVLPALLSLLGDRVEKGRVPLLHKRRRAAGENGVWSFIVGRVLRRPLLATVLAAAPLVALVAVAFQMHTVAPSFSTLPQKLEVVKTYKRIQIAFQGGSEPAQVVVSAKNVKVPTVRKGISALRKQAAATAELRGHSEVQVNPSRTVAVVSIPVGGNGTNSKSVRGLETLRKDVIPRTIGAVAGVEVAVSGTTAASKDFNDVLRTHSPIVFAFVLGLAFLLLLVAFRSIVIAVKAVVLNLLSVGAAYGVLVLVFQHGLGESILGFKANGGVVAWLPLFLFVVLFGLSMDYHVFILSRVREAVDRGSHTDDAVAHGIRATAGTVTSAAVVMVAVFSIFATLSQLDLKQLGVGLASAILIDATIVRAVLLPATMKLLGRWNWYLPRWLEWIPRVSFDADGSHHVAAPAAPEQC